MLKITERIDPSNVIIFSPHLDDAVLSMGSLMVYLVKRKIDIDVISVFTAGSKISSDLTKKLLNLSGFNNAEDYFKERIKEDVDAILSLGNIKIQNLGFVDGAWREGELGKPLYPHTTLLEIMSRDEDLKKEILKVLQKVKISSKTLIFAPLARGKHVDHQLVRDICLEIFPNIIFYEDFPYSDNYPNEEEFISKNDLTAIKGLDNYYKEKELAILKYKTQQMSLFNGRKIEFPLETFYLKVL